ncbi:MAG: GPW/gp25 family protein [bacterium]
MASLRSSLINESGNRGASHISQQIQIKKATQIWTKDLSYKLMTRGEVTNIDSINQSIELILATLPGERLFRPQFGSNFKLRLFDTFDNKLRGKIYNDLVTAIERWERRITLVKEEIKIQLDRNNYAIRIQIPYKIRQSNIKGEFHKNIKL